MRCKYCEIEIEGRATICPLCHEKIEQNPEEGEKTFYPPKENVKNKPKKALMFDTVFFLAAIPIFLICLTANVLSTPDLLWFSLVGASELYIYLFVKNTIHSANSIAVKILWQALMIFLMVWVAELVFSSFELPDTENWVLEYALPAIIGISVLVMAIFTIVLGKKMPSVMVDCIFLSIAGFLPMILFGCKLIENSLPSTIVLLLSSITIVCCLIYGRGNLVNEFKKRFHI